MRNNYFAVLSAVLSGHGVAFGGLACGHIAVVGFVYAVLESDHACVVHKRPDAESKCAEEIAEYHICTGNALGLAAGKQEVVAAVCPHHLPYDTIDTESDEGKEEETEKPVVLLPSAAQAVFVSLEKQWTRYSG